MIIVEIIKVHKKYEELFPLGSAVEFRKLNSGECVVKSPINGKNYDANDLCKAFSDSCTYGQCFKRIQKKKKETPEERIIKCKKAIEFYEGLIAVKSDPVHYGSLIESYKKEIEYLTKKQ